MASGVVGCAWALRQTQESRTEVTEETSTAIGAARTPHCRQRQYGSTPHQIDLSVQRPRPDTGSFVLCPPSP